MKRGRGRAIAAVSVTTLAALTLAACSSGGASGSGSAGSPVSGGTLKLVGASDVDHLDTASAYYNASYTLERAFTRQLFSYPADTDLARAMPVGWRTDFESWLAYLRGGSRTPSGRTVRCLDLSSARPWQWLKWSLVFLNHPRLLQSLTTSRCDAKGPA